MLNVSSDHSVYLNMAFIVFVYEIWRQYNSVVKWFDKIFLQGFPARCDVHKNPPPKHLIFLTM